MPRERRANNTLRGEQPNSGQRLCIIARVEVNGTLCAHRNTVVFGWQNRLRDRVLIADEKLDRFHIG